MKRVMWVTWPSFLMTGLIEMLVFAVVDPTELQLLSRIDVSRTAIYTIAFFLLWIIVALSSALTLYLSMPDPGVDAGDRSIHHGKPDTQTNLT